MDKQKQKVFCMKCKKDLSGIQNLKKCKCGSRDFVYGDTVVKTEDGFACSCGNAQMKKVAHINMNPTYVTTYQCCECNASISTETYYESPYY